MYVCFIYKTVLDLYLHYGKHRETEGELISRHLFEKLTVPRDLSANSIIVRVVLPLQQTHFRA